MQVTALRDELVVGFSRCLDGLSIASVFGEQNTLNIMMKTVIKMDPQSFFMRNK